LELEVTSSDCRIDQLIGERFLVLPNVEQPFKILPRGETVDLLRRGFAEVPKEDLVTVRIKAKGQVTAKLRLNVLAVLLGLLSPQFCVLRRPFGFDDCECLTILAEENIVAKFFGFGRALPLVDSGAHRVFPVTEGRHEELNYNLRPISQVPASLIETEVDDSPSCFGLSRHIPDFEWRDDKFLIVPHFTA
jgi:hypothetical protein